MMALRSSRAVLFALFRAYRAGGGMDYTETQSPPSPRSYPHPMGRGRTIYAPGSCWQHFAAYPADRPVNDSVEAWGGRTRFHLAFFELRQKWGAK
jgi:hypothetical protein